MISKISNAVSMTIFGGGLLGARGGEGHSLTINQWGFLSCKRFLEKLTAVRMMNVCLIYPLFTFFYVYLLLRTKCLVYAAFVSVMICFHIHLTNSVCVLRNEYTTMFDYFSF